MIPQRFLRDHFEAAFYFLGVANIVSKWASKHLWGVPFILLAMVPLHATHLGIVAPTRVPSHSAESRNRTASRRGYAVGSGAVTNVSGRRVFSGGGILRKLPVRRKK